MPIFVQDAYKDKATVAFALKLGLCATLCYIFYHAVDWPGIGTSVTTVLIVGLSTTGAIKQKLIFRIVGAVIGGLILELGATAFLFPNMDSITSLTVLVGAVALLSAWWAAGRQFNYIGLQIAFSFYLVAFEGFSAPTDLSPARDRLIGILVALVIMALVDLIWPVRTVAAMRRGLASVIRADAELFRLVDMPGDYQSILAKADGLRDRVGKTVAALRSLNDVVAYEFGADRENQIRDGETILRAAFRAVGLFWNQLSVLHNEQDRDFLTDPSFDRNAPSARSSTGLHGGRRRAVHVILPSRHGGSASPYQFALWRICPQHRQAVRRPRSGHIAIWAPWVDGSNP